MMEIENESKYYFLVADLYKQLLDIFSSHAHEEFDDYDYFWWAEWIVCRIIRNFNEGKEILADIEREEKDQ